MAAPPRPRRLAPPRRLTTLPPAARFPLVPLAASAQTPGHSPGGKKKVYTAPVVQKPTVVTKVVEVKVPVPTPVPVSEDMRQARIN